MRLGVKRTVFVLAGCLVWLTACETNSTNTGDFFSLPNPLTTMPNPFGPTPGPDTTGAIGSALPQEQHPKTNFTPSDPNDDLSLAKENFRQGNYGLAERYFRKAVESGPKDAEAWLGLAAAYDRLRRFELADRAYAEVIRIAGPTPEVLNNQGYSYMLRGQFGRARQILMEARAKDPANPFIQNNLALLEDSVRGQKPVR
jgi:tetratricopeptide (TPR) repeat protein